jgi:hypothetical protein
MKRFFPTLVLLIAALLLLASGVNATLDRLDRAPAQNAFVFYNDKGEVVLCFFGAPALAQKFPRPLRPSTSSLYHRGESELALVPIPGADGSRYF